MSGGRIIFSIPRPPIFYGVAVMDRSALKSRLEEFELGAFAEKFAALASPCAFFGPDAPADSNSIGKSRLSGFPDLPSGIEWPATEDGHFTFLAQLNCADIPPEIREFPGKGILYFFIGDNDCPGDVEVRVIFCPDPTLAEHGTFPSDFSPIYEDEDEEENYETPYSICFEVGLSVPELTDPLVAGLGLSEDEQDRFLNFKVEWNQQAVLPHTLGGLVQFAMYDPRPSDEKWVSLIEFGYDDLAGPNFVFWDAGNLKILIREEDLDARDFSRVHAVIESS